MRLRMAVQQKKRRAAAAVPHVDPRFAGVDGGEREAVEHRESPR
jgi:hypothetical protein